MPSQRGNDKSNKSIGNWSARRLDDFTRDNSASQSGMLSIGPINSFGKLLGVLAHSNMTITDLHTARSSGTRSNLTFRFWINDVPVTVGGSADFLVTSGQTVPTTGANTTFPPSTIKKGEMFELKVLSTGSADQSLNGRVYASWSVD